MFMGNMMAAIQTKLKKNETQNTGILSVNPSGSNLSDTAWILLILSYFDYQVNPNSTHKVQGPDWGFAGNWQGQSQDVFSYSG